MKQAIAPQNGAQRVRKPNKKPVFTYQGHLNDAPEEKAKVRPTLPVGQRVKANHFLGRIIQVATYLEVMDRENPDKTHRVPLRSPLYTVKLDTRKKVSWVATARQIWIPEGASELKLFRDEFDVIEEW